MSESRDTPVTYSSDEAAQIRAMVKDESATLSCPRCQGELRVGTPVVSRSGADPVWEIRCQECHRTAYAAEVADSHGKG